MSDIEVHVPKVGMSAVDVEILEVRVSVGDSVREGQALFEAGSDKVDFEIGAPVDGVVTGLLAEAGDVIDVGAVVATIGGHDMS